MKIKHKTLRWSNYTGWWWTTTFGQLHEETRAASVILSLDGKDIIKSKWMLWKTGVLFVTYEKAKNT